MKNVSFHLNLSQVFFLKLIAITVSGTLSTDFHYGVVRPIDLWR
jgi:hypothetical protein